MYIDGSCPGLGIGIKISGLLVVLLVIDPNKVCCITRCTFSLMHIIPRARELVEKAHQEIFSHVFI